MKEQQPANAGADERVNTIVAASRYFFIFSPLILVNELVLWLS